MCNPRRVTVTATRDIAEAWRREVSRTVQLTEQVTGEARLRQTLSSRLGRARPCVHSRRGWSPARPTGRRFRKVTAAMSRAAMCCTGWMSRRWKSSPPWPMW